MIPTVGDFLRLIERIAPTKLAEPWDNPGLQIGDSGTKIRKVFSSLDPTLDTLVRTHKNDAQVLFTHHPLIFKPVSHIECSTYPGKILAEAARKNVAVVSAHTNLDIAKGGINDILANLMGLEDIEVLKPHDGAPEAGLGRIGNLPQPLDLLGLSNALKSALGATHIRMAGQAGKHRIKRIAVVGGSGGSMVSIAAKMGAQALITGDIGHHAALEATFLGIALIDSGHFHTEQLAFNIFSRNLERFIQEEGWEVAVLTDEIQTDPIRVFSDNQKAQDAAPQL